MDRWRSFVPSCPQEAFNTAIECLRIATKLDRFRETARMLLDPWIVEAALARFAEKQLTREQQEVVLQVTRTPAKVML
jgi:hypothetical protein